MTDAIQYVSQESLENLKKEYETLKDVTIPEIAKRIDDAKQQGDLSENAEYHQAREDMSWAQGRLQELEEIIGNSQVIQSQKGGADVHIGSSLTVKNLTSKQDREYTIVGAQEVNPAKGLISNESPLGQAFLGKSAGDEVEVITPAGKQKFKILKIK
jgi:transcription elongation factor GreA